MSYLTKYKLNFYGDDELLAVNITPIQLNVFKSTLSAVIKYFGGIHYTGNYSIGFILNEFADEISRELTWYDWEKDMKILSCLFPDIIFELEGYGSEIGDWWKTFFHNGASTSYKASIPSYNDYVSNYVK